MRFEEVREGGLNTARVLCWVAPGAAVDVAGACQSAVSIVKLLCILSASLLGAGCECEIGVRTYTIHVEDLGSDCSTGRGSHTSRV